MFSGSCSNLHQLNNLRKVNISNNCFSAESLVAPKDTWLYVYLIISITLTLTLFCRHINAFNSFTQIIREPIDLKLLRLNHFFSETIELPIKQLSVLELMDLHFGTCTPIANGCNGVVCKINVDVDEFKERTCTTVLMDELAIKMMFNFCGSDEGTIAQKKKFDKEYIFPLAHPHWSHVQLFNYFRGRRVDSLLVGKDLEDFEDTTTYFTMELCRTNLKNYIQENKNNISVRSALLMIYQILDGIKHLYDHEVVHLDLKDDNIFIANRKRITGNQVVIGDFGTIHPFIYRKHEASNIPNRSPELVNFRENHPPVDIRKNDVWATGCILFQLLEEGKHPFCDSVNTKFNICTASLPLFDRHGEATKQFLKLLWNRDPNKRLEPKIALGICGFLLWGAPTLMYPENFKIFSPEELQSIDGFKKFCKNCEYYRESELQMWLKHRIDEVYTTYIQTKDEDNFDIDFMVHISFLISFSPSELLSCMKVLSTIYSQN